MSALLLSISLFHSLHFSLVLFCFSFESLITLLQLPLKKKKILNLISGVIRGAKYSAYVVMMIYAYEQGCSEAQMAVALSK